MCVFAPRIFVWSVLVMVVALIQFVSLKLIRSVPVVVVKCFQSVIRLPTSAVFSFKFDFSSRSSFSFDIILVLAFKAL